MNISSLILSGAIIVAASFLAPLSSASYAAVPDTAMPPGRYATNGKVTLWVRAGDPVPFFLRDTAPVRPAASGQATHATESDYLTIVGKRAAWASSLPNARDAAPLMATSSCRDYVVIVGKRSVLASSLVREERANDPMRFCCVSNRSCSMGPSCCPRP